MKNVKLLILSLCLFISTISTLKADVWKHEREWEAKDEAEFVQWISSDSFNRRIFIDPQSPYAGLATDCADVVLRQE